MAKKLNYLGVDLGGPSIKIVELKNVGNRPQLVTYGFVEGAYSIIKDTSAEARNAVAVHLKELIKRSRVSTDKTVAALPSYSVFSSIISLPAMSRKDLISAVRWEAKKFVPIPLEEMILDWEVLGQDTDAKDSKQAKTAAEGDASGKKAKKDKKEEKESKESEKVGMIQKGNIKVLLTAAPKEMVNRYVELFRDVGLQLVGLETESFSLQRSLVGNDRNPVMVIDVGSQATSISIFADNVPMLHRSIDLGGKSVTKSLAESMGLPEHAAEQFKHDMGGSFAGTSIDKLPQPVRYVINSVVNEVRYILNIYQGQHKKTVSKIILTGGSAFLGNFTESIEKVFNIKTYIGDPWARVIHPVEIDTMLRQLGPRLAVAVGLAMREIV
ncbi:MAG: pilus assembly protein PilM [Patescibacteria group bacterium]|nr:pilus assembly protein PilM [Patescibacteria group bacterium]MDD5715437.1 pilus assembly protein PilM [Patescibacteria group bacterium]